MFDRSTFIFKIATLGVLLLTPITLSGCQNKESEAAPSALISPSPTPTATVITNNTTQSSPSPTKQTAAQAAADVKSVTVLVNKQFGLPPSFEPDDLVFVNIPFTFKDMVDKRKMRKEAGAAIEQMVAGAKKDNIFLAGVSAYRSYATQKSLFNNYVQVDGLEKAKTYSAEPGHSEHETGLAIDLAGSDGKCAAQDCFAATKEAKWIAEHAAEYGFIVRYPKGKEAITGYQYEPWHIRYVGVRLAKELTDKGLTLEEYYNAVPVSKR
jgi:D-alanyl-D-alanine carboxypeptidase